MFTILGKWEPYMQNSHPLGNKTHFCQNSMSDGQPEMWADETRFKYLQIEQNNTWMDLQALL